MPPSTTPSSAVAAEIRAELARKGRTIADLASEIGATPATLGRRLSGQSPLRFDELAAIANALGLTVTALIQRAKDAEAVAS